MIESHEALYGRAKAGAVEKLEQILRAEDEARAIVAQSRDAARATLDEARAAAIRMQAESEAQAKTDAARQSASVIANAKQAAETDRSREAEALRALIAAAEDRVDDAVTEVLGEMVG